MGQQKILPLHLEKKQLSINDFIATIQKLNQTIEILKQKNSSLLKQKKFFQQQYTNLQVVKHSEQTQLKKKIDSQTQKIRDLQNQLKIKLKKILQQLQDLVNKKEQSEQYDSSSQQEQQNTVKGKSRPPNMGCIKDQFVIVWKQKKDIVDKIQNLSRQPDCLTVKITGRQFENGNQGIKELSQILSRVCQLKKVVVLNLYFNNNKFGKGVSLNFWQVLRATIIAHLKIKFLNLIIGPKTWKKNQKVLEKQVQLYPKRVVVNVQIQGWK